MVRPVHTYSIVAYDPESKELGVAVQSHYFNVGSLVPWAEAGVGAVATQSFVEVSYGPLGLALMRAGKSAEQALQSLLASDAQADQRQVAMVDALGGVAVHTGSKCIQAAGHKTGAGYSVQANLMRNDTVWGAMSEAYEGTQGDMAERLMSALEAAEAEGGDIRGKQSAALLVVGGERTGNPWQGRLFDVRVDDHAGPLPELRRLLELRGHTAWATGGEDADGRVAGGGAVRAGGAGVQRLGGDDAGRGEQPGIAFLARGGDGGRGEGGRRAANPRRVYALDPAWRELVPRLVGVGSVPDKPELVKRLTDA